MSTSPLSAPSSDSAEDAPTRNQEDPRDHLRRPAADESVHDPALNDQIGSDWTDEGGAMPQGPATGPILHETDTE